MTRNTEAGRFCACYGCGKRLRADQAYLLELHANVRKPTHWHCNDRARAKAHMRYLAVVLSAIGSNATDGVTYP